MTNTGTSITEQHSNIDKSAIEDDANSSNSNDIMDVDAPISIQTNDESNSEHQTIKPIIKTEPVDNSTDLFLDDELRLQIEKSIELVVNEFSRNTGCLTENLPCTDETIENDTSHAGTNEMTPVQEESLQHDLVVNDDVSKNTDDVSNTAAVSSSYVRVNDSELPPKIPNDITVIPINTTKVVNIKSEPRDTTIEVDRKFKKSPEESTSSDNRNITVPSKDIHLPSLTNNKHHSLTILPVVTSTPVKSGISDAGSIKTRVRSDSVEFSLTADVTIKTVPSTSTSAGNPPSCKMNSSLMAPQLKQVYNTEMNMLQSSGHGIPTTLRSSSLRNDPHFGLPITPPQMFLDSGMKTDVMPSSGTCTSFNTKYCSYKPSSVVTSNSLGDLSSCSYSSPSTCLSKSCAVPHSIPGPATTPLAQCQQSSNLALMPYSSQQSSFCANFNSYAQTPSPLSSPKHLKPPINTSNACRMSSSSPVPAYMRSREPCYSAPILCDSFSATTSGMIPPESPSFRSTPPWSLPSSSSFRSPTSPATFNFTLPSPSMGSIAPPPAVQSNSAMFPSCTNQSNSLMLPTSSHHQKPTQNSSYPFRSNFTPSFNPNSSYQRSQCCFSSQIQCFNSACATSSQQQFSIVQHSTRLSNLKSNSIDSVSSLLQYHTYFKKY